MKNHSLFLITMIMSNLIGCKEDALLNTQAEEQRYRPNLHFTPAKNWMNDPNGMFYLDGQFHLYFQYNPNDNVWGPMHWGHAISSDGLKWEEQPIALYPDKNGTIFSGSAVVDHQNTSGFGTIENPPIVAIFTSHSHEKEKAGRLDYETQSIAYSLDQGMTWTKYEANPVIANQGTKDFRDPKVFWYEDTKQWILVLAAGQEVQLYSSPNLKQWTKTASFGQGIGNHKGVWECPDLFPLPVLGTNVKKWVLLVSINPGGPNGGSATQYFVGDFNGENFVLDPPFASQMEEEHSFWVDFGRDNYAGVTYNNIEASQGERFFQGWMSNWQYASKVPTTTWRSAMTLIRKIALTPHQESYRLVAMPYIPKKTAPAIMLKNIEASASPQRLITQKDISLTATQITFEWEGENFEWSFSNAQKEELKVGYDSSKNNYYINRMRAGKNDFSDQFAPHISTAPKKSINTKTKVTMLLDKTSMEVFFDDGLTVFSEIFFLKTPFESVSLSGAGIMKSLEAYVFDK